MTEYQGTKRPFFTLMLGLETMFGPTDTSYSMRPSPWKTATGKKQKRPRTHRHKASVKRNKYHAK